MPKYEYISYKDMNSYYADVIRKITNDNRRPDVVFAPMRGGADFGVKVSNYYDIPFESIQWQTRSGNERNVEQLQYLFNKYDQQCILIVDDICDSGTTLKEIAEVALSCEQSDVLFAAAIENLESPFSCDYSSREISRCEDTQWFIFPWEEWWRRLD
jgi:hypoxanthine phosphoribosyltransferase